MPLLEAVQITENSVFGHLFRLARQHGMTIEFRCDSMHLNYHIRLLGQFGFGFQREVDLSDTVLSRSADAAFQYLREVVTEMIRKVEAAQRPPSELIREHILRLAAQHEFQVRFQPVRNDGGFTFAVRTAGHEIPVEYNPESSKPLEQTLREFEDVFLRIKGRLSYAPRPMGFGESLHRAQNELEASRTRISPVDLAARAMHHYRQLERDMAGSTPSRPEPKSEPEPTPPKVKRHIAYRE